MVLTQIQNYLAKHQKASLEELTNYTHSSADALRPMLNRLIRKGRICQIPSKKCGGCTCCNTESLEFYQWLNKSANKST